MTMHRYRIRRSRFVRLGLAFLAPAVLLFGFAGLLFSIPDAVWVIFCALALGGLFAGLALLQLGTAWARPAGLRMDKDGISGFYLAPILWRDVREVGLFIGPANHRHADENNPDAAPHPTRMFLALRIANNETWWFENTTLQRITLAMRGRPKQWDALVPLASLDCADPRTLVDHAFDLHEGRH